MEIQGTASCQGDGNSGQPLCQSDGNSGQPSSRGDGNSDQGRTSFYRSILILFMGIARLQLLCVREQTNFSLLILCLRLGLLRDMDPKNSRFFIHVP
ncbi:hypothetical protein RRG08_052419 [Elysia crispata]|uniref:Uncharacterized protein n=1 Tax=Elysia crispata TaxID=231223 RepID=A0AAE1E830_9GAST|nr:hypothetical protein RRG08_052419 [Elysia crispata]